MKGRRLSVSAVHRILSSPFPILQKFVIGGHDIYYELDHRGSLLLDAPNLRSLSSSTYHIVPFVKPCGSSPTHNSLESFSINAGWSDVVQMIPRPAVSLPRLKSLSLTYTDDLWDILQILDTPNLESLVVNCGLAEWLQEVDSPIPVLHTLHELTWYTDSDAADETPNLRHLLQHCPNIEHFLYSCQSISAHEKDEYLQRQDADSVVLALSESLDDADNNIPRLCTRLRRVRLACASFEQVRDLILTRPALEYVSLQYQKPGDDIVTQSKTVWQEKVDLVRWIKSKVDFEFEMDRADIGSDMQEEEGVFWDPSGNSLAFVDLQEVDQVLLQHLSRCKTLVLQPPSHRIDRIIGGLRLTPRVSVVHRILSSPFPILREIVIGGDNSHYYSDHRGPLLLDAPNLRSLSSSTHNIIPFVKTCGSTPAHKSLENFSINGGWRDVMEMLPRTATDDLWNILRILDTPNLESFSVECGLADWFEDIHTPTPVLSNLRELNWYTEPGASQDETPNLHHLLQHCPSIESLLYNVRSSSVDAKEAYLMREDVDSLILALSDSLDEIHNSTPRLCPRLKRLHLACASYEQVRELVLFRPALEYVSMQYRKPGDDIVTRSKTVSRKKVDLVRWIRSKIEFEFGEDGVAVGPVLQEEEGVFWDLATE
ncbi:hypothetical protein FS837_011242 [Tulasnella sp. UAMH 9824]|nr:hypothetical protein FS837_011242 [Tulasnella sp. UAMH 9824]